MPPTRIAPSVLDCDFTRLGDQVRAVCDAGAEVLHLDVMDGHFVPNLSIGVPIVAAIRRAAPKAILDTHLMITDPERYAKPFADAGSDNITFHVEVTTDPMRTAAKSRSLGVKVGVALNPGTPAETVLGLLPHVDIILIMTVWPGFGGQRFLTECLTKLKTLAPRLRPDQWLEVDGGINADTTRQAVAAGANTLVAGSAIYRTADPAVAFAELQKLAQAAANGPTNV